MATIPQHEIVTDLFLHRPNMIWGGTGSGKTFVIRDIMHKLRDVIPQVIVFCPTNAQNGDYDGIVPPEFIHPEPTDALLSRIWKERERLVGMYKEANDLDIMARVVDKIKLRLTSTERGRVDRVNRAAAELVARRSTTGAQAYKQMKRDLDRVRRAVYMPLIERHRGVLLGPEGGLSSEERHCVKYAKFNPNLLIVIDDCSDALRALANKSQTFGKMFYQCRHLMITVIIVSHAAASIMPPKLRANARTNIFTDYKSFSSYIALEKLEVPGGRAGVGEIMKTMGTSFKKLLHDKDTGKFYYITAKDNPAFTFNSSQLVSKFLGQLAAGGD